MRFYLECLGDWLRDWTNNFTFQKVFRLSINQWAKLAPFESRNPARVEGLIKRVINWSNKNEIIT